MSFYNNLWGLSNFRVLMLVLSGLSLITSCTGAFPQKEASPRLYVFDCGRLDYNSIVAFGLSDSDTLVREMFVPCYLIEHKGKRLIWDAGLPLAAVGKGPINPVPGVDVSMTYERSLLDQLKELSLGTEDIDYLVMSHLHFDHAGAANSFTSSIWIMQRPEYELAVTAPEKITGADPRLFSEIKNVESFLIEGDYDIFDDGKVKIISTPGHTIGHQVLLLDLMNTGKVVLSGDLFHFRATRRLSAVPVYNYSPQKTLKSMAKVEQLLKESGATLWIEHDMELANSLNKSPIYYD